MRVLGWILILAGLILAAYLINGYMKTDLVPEIWGFRGKVRELYLDAIGIHIFVSAILIASGLLALFSSSDESKNEQGESEVQNSGDAEKKKSSSTSQDKKLKNFSGERSLDNDAYKLALIEDYKITRHEVLQKFVCNSRIFNTIDAALEYAAKKDIKAQSESDSKNDVSEQQLTEKNEKKNIENQISNSSDATSSSSSRGSKLRKIVIALFATAITLTVLVFALISIMPGEKTQVAKAVETKKSIHDVEISSTSFTFSGARLGGKVKEYMHGDRVERNGKAHFFTRNNAELRYPIDKDIPLEQQGLNQEITVISFSCDDSTFGKSTGPAKIDDISCDTTAEQLSRKNWKKLCWISDGTPLNMPITYFLYHKNNARIKVDGTQTEGLKLFYLELVSKKVTESDNYRKSYIDCEKLENLREKAKELGFSSVREMQAKSE